MSFEDVLPVLALALLAGLRRSAPRPLVDCAASARVAGRRGSGLAHPGAPASPLLVTALVIVPGALAAWDRALPVGVVAVLACVVGLMAGEANGAAMASVDVGLRSAPGAAAAAFVTATLVAAAVGQMRTGWMRIAARAARQLVRGARSADDRLDAHPALIRESLAAWRARGEAQARPAVDARTAAAIRWIWIPSLASYFPLRPLSFGSVAAPGVVERDQPPELLNTGLPELPPSVGAR